MIPRSRSPSLSLFPHSPLYRSTTRVCSSLLPCPSSLYLCTVCFCRLRTGKGEDGRTGTGRGACSLSEPCARGRNAGWQIGFVGLGVHGLTSKFQWKGRNEHLDADATVDADGNLVVTAIVLTLCQNGRESRLTDAGAIDIPFSNSCLCRPVRNARHLLLIEASVWFSLLVRLHCTSKHRDGDSSCAL